MRPIRALLAFLALASAGSAFAQTPFARPSYQQIQQDGVNLPRQRTINFLGGTMTCVDNPSAKRTECTPTQSPLFSVAASNPIGSGLLGIYYDSVLQAVRLHNADNTFTELSPGFAQTFPGTSSVPAATMRLQAGLGGASDFFRITPNDGYNSPWNCSAKLVSNGADPHPDFIVQCGINLSSTGLIDSGHEAYGWAVESKCSTALGCTAPGQMEAYDTFADAFGHSWRIITRNMRLDGSGLDVGIVGTSACLGSDHTTGGNINDANMICAVGDHATVNSKNGLNELYSGNTLFEAIADDGAGHRNTFIWNPTSTVHSTAILPSSDNAVDVGSASLRERKVYAYTVDSLRGIRGCDTIGNRPSCTNAEEGHYYTVCATAGVRSTVYLCLGSDAGVYSWSTLKDGGP